jgi:outer membrane protein assembly factor BamB
MRIFFKCRILTKLMIYFSFAFFLVSCSKKDGSITDNANNGNNGNNGVVNELSNFKVSIIERSYQTTLIKWTASTSSNAQDSVRYKVVLNNVTIDINLTRLTDSLRNVLINNNYAGSVIAYTNTGLTKTASFNLERMEGRSYGSTILGNGITVKNVFTNGVVNPFVWYKALGDYNGATPTLSNDTIFMSNGYGYSSIITALNKISGSTIWSVQPNYSILNGTSITYSQGLLYAATDSGVVCLKASNGNNVWRNPRPYVSITSHLNTNPVIDNNKLFIATSNNSSDLVALNLGTGTAIWQRNFIGQACKTPIAYNNKIIINAGNTVYALDQNTGAVLWQKVGFGRSFNSPIIFDDLIIVVNDNGFVSALNANTGIVVWSKFFTFHIDTYTNLAVGSGLFFFTITIEPSPGTYRSKILAIDVTNGNMVWEFTTLVDRATNLIYANNSVYFTGAGPFGGMLRLNALSGNIEWGVLGTTANSEHFSLDINNKVYYNHENGNYK